jgi:hypothetical protein
LEDSWDALATTPSVSSPRGNDERPEDSEAGSDEVSRQADGGWSEACLRQGKQRSDSGDGIF